MFKNRNRLVKYLFVIFLIAIALYSKNLCTYAAISNVVQGKPASQVATGTDVNVRPYLPSRGVDGDYSNKYSRWYSAGANGTRGIKVDLQGSYVINKWRVYSMSQTYGGWDNMNIIKDFKLQGSNDNSTWFDIDTVTNNSSALCERTISATVVNYVRLVITNGNQENNNWAAVMDFQVDGFLNAPPTLNTTVGITAFTEDGPPVVIDNGLTVSDSNNTTLANANVAITGNFETGNDVLSFNNDRSTMGNIIGSYNSTTGVLSLNSAGATATLAQWQAALRTVTYNNISHTPNTNSRTISIKVNNGMLDSAVSTKTVSVTAVNDIPTITAPATLAAAINKANSITGISFSDLDAGSGTETVTFNVSSGTLSASSSSGVTASGSGTGTLILSGTIENINAFISAGNATFTTVTDNASDVNLNVGINDGAKTASAVTILKIKAELPTVITTDPVTPITAVGAGVAGEVIRSGGKDVTERGFVYGTAPGATITSGTKVKVATTGTGKISTTLIGLTPSTAYYVRTYATNSEGTSYGNEVRFNTLKASAIITITTPQNGTVSVTNATDLGNGTYRASGGAVIILTATPNTGYNFYCWYKNGVEVSKLPKSYFTVTDDATYSVSFKPIPTATVTTSAFGTGEVSNDGVNWSSSVTGNYSVGTTINLTARETSVDSPFMYWIDNNNKVISNSKAYSLNLGSNTSLKAVFNTKVDNTHLVVFRNGNGDIIQSSYVSKTGDITFPSNPYMYGYTFTGWDKTSSQIQAIAGSVVVNALFTKNAQYTVSVTNGTITDGTGSGAVSSGSYYIKDFVTVAANAPQDGQKFSYWQDSNGNIVCYDLTYKFYVSSNVSLTAVYMDDVEAEGTVGAILEQKASIVIKSVTIDSNEKKITFIAERVVPDGCSVISHGIILTKDASLDEDTFIIDAPGVLKGTAGTTGLLGTYVLNKTNVNLGETWYGRGFVIYKDSNGNLITVYSAIQSGTMSV